MRPVNISYSQQIEVLKMSLESIKTNKKVLYAMVLLIFFSVIIYILAIEYKGFIISSFESKNILGLILFLLIDILVLILAFLIVYIFYAIKGGEEDEFE